MDILFRTEEYVFSYRVAGICIQNGKVLLQKPTNDTAFAFPRGHVTFGEFIMMIQFGKLVDIDNWMCLVEEISWNFPGLETKEKIIGVLLFSLVVPINIGYHLVHDYSI